MNTSSTPEPDPALRKVLRQWVVDTPLPPGFQQQVWARLHRTEVAAPGDLRAWLAMLLEVMLPRPKVALSYLSLVVAAGVLAGSWTAQVRSSHLQAALSERYMQSVDPYWAGTPQP